LLLRTVDVEKLVEDGHAVRSIWELVGRLDLRWYHAQIAAVEGGAGREHTDPQLLISLWLYAYSRGISSARELARRCSQGLFSQLQITKGAATPSRGLRCATRPLNESNNSCRRSDCVYGLIQSND
jgi:hypothetical protein